ncbi:MAG: hypothetical protein IKD63_00190, partial [Oscillospiraceae bacterium]|nr:hypothetical protein [Oscillospiraceae bacterium]
MEDTLCRLLQIEEASGRIMDRVELQKEAYRQEMEEKTAAFDRQMEHETEEYIAGLREELRAEREKKLETLSAETKAREVSMRSL